MLLYTGTVVWLVYCLSALYSYWLFFLLFWLERIAASHAERGPCFIGTRCAAGGTEEGRLIRSRLAAVWNERNAVVAQGFFKLSILCPRSGVPWGRYYIRTRSCVKLESLSPWKARILKAANIRERRYMISGAIFPHLVLPSWWGNAGSGCCCLLWLQGTRSKRLTNSNIFFLWVTFLFLFTTRSG